MFFVYPTGTVDLITIVALSDDFIHFGQETERWVEVSDVDLRIVKKVRYTCYPEDRDEAENVDGRIAFVVCHFCFHMLGKD